MRSKKDILKAVHTSLSNGIRAGKTKDARAWLESKGLSIDQTGACFSSGQLHHRKEQSFIDELESIGFLTQSEAATNTGKHGYNSFAKEAIVFALRNDKSEVVNLYGIRINAKSQPSEYLNDEGIYPSYPHQLTERLYITDTVLDAATLLESRILGNRDAVISLHEGKMSEERYTLINQLSQLKELIFISYKKETKQVVIKYVGAVNPHLIISNVELPQDHSLNDMLVNYGADGISQLLAEQTIGVEVITPKENESILKQIGEGKLTCQTTLGTFFVLGNLSTDLGTLKASLFFEEAGSGRKYRTKIDLYDNNQLMNYAKSISEKENAIDISQLEAELLKLTDLLETHRDKQLEAEHGTKEKTQNLLPPEKEKEAIEFLSKPNLIQHIDKLIESSGIVGEANNRKLVFVIASTYKMPNTLHGLIQGTSGSGKTHLINAVASLMPPEDILNMTRVTSKSFYHYKNDDLINRLVLIQDIDGLDEEAMYAFREMQSAGFVSSSTTYKNKAGQLVSTVKRVNAKFASLVATTHAEIYFDNLSRSIVLGVDESEEQTLLIIQQQNKQIAGLVDARATVQAKELLQNCIRTLKPYEVVNRYANQIQLPVEAKMLRRLNNHYQAFVTQITLLNQYQRSKDEQGRLITTKEDLKQACEILFDAIMWKIDELDSSLRQFFERLKIHIKKQNASGQHRFTVREIRQTFNLSSSQADRYIQDLKRLEYIQPVEGSANKGYKYKVSYWDDMDKIRQRVKAELMTQIDNIEDK